MDTMVKEQTCNFIFVYGLNDQQIKILTRCAIMHFCIKHYVFYLPIHPMSGASYGKELAYHIETYGT
jgi:hypothetical protein